MMIMTTKKKNNDDNNHHLLSNDNRYNDTIIKCDYVNYVHSLKCTTY